ncbi:MAG TPA: 2-C-methyl-D-erythritol 4-phosphate cytidylyltransferase [Burkholderiales bacterium]|nr:2-C-methyl-D-erythritol 4-phosphate cytidylyltransferase [Burkholderiales bacterium]
MNHYALIPAAGTGERLGGNIPKQYLPLRGKPMLFYSVQRLCASPRIKRVYVVLAHGDERFSQYDWRAFAGKLAPLYCGGATRAASVLNGLLAAKAEIAADDWVLVHDAARPCLNAELLEKLLNELCDDGVGGLLALPVADTLKRADSAERVLRTEPREQLWRAQTPQMFRYATLVRALQAMQNAQVTDEAGAIEGLGLQPRLVASDARNLKITHAQDLPLAELILNGMERA